MSKGASAPILVAVVGVLCVAAPAAPPKERGLVLHYTFDEGSGTVLKDRSGNGNDAVITNAKFVKAGKGYALEFNGKDSVATAAVSDRLKAIKDAVTVEAWINPMSAPKGEPGIIGEGPNITGTYGFTLYSATPRVYFYVRSGDNSRASPVPIRKWTHVVGTFDGARVQLFINGKPASSLSSKHGEVSHGMFLVMGQSGTSYYHGLIDDVRIYDRALSPKEIADHFKRGAKEKGIKTSSLAVSIKRTATGAPTSSVRPGVLCGLQP